jgi:hypothetical protein
MKIIWEEKDLETGMRVSRITESGTPEYATIIGSKQVSEEFPATFYNLLGEDGMTKQKWTVVPPTFLMSLEAQGWFPCSLPKVMKPRA